MRLGMLPLAVGLLLSKSVAAQTVNPGSFSKNAYCFVENKGQMVDQYGNARADVQFKIKSNDVQMFVGNGEIHYQWASMTADMKATVPIKTMEQLKTVGEQGIDVYRLDLKLVGANPNAAVIKEQVQDYYENHSIAALDYKQVQAKSYNRITYKNVYPNIDWVFHIKDNKVEHDFVVKPGGNVSDIQMQYSGSEKIEINADGSLTVTTPKGTITEAAPYAFQQDGKRVQAHYVLQGNTVRFNNSAYQGTLTIDPAISWSTYFGGNGLYEQIGGLDMSNTDRLYFLMFTFGADNIITTGAYQTTFQGFTDLILAKFNTAGALIWATYYGGPDQEMGNSLVCDSIGNVYVGAQTLSTSGISSLGAHQTTYGGGTSDVAIIKFDSTGNRLWATYYGGSDADENVMLNVENNKLYVAGYTRSTSQIATSGAHKSSLVHGSDLFLAKFTLDGVRQWATYYGGESSEGLSVSLATDGNGGVYLASTTSSVADIATPSAHQTTKGASWDGFIVKFNTEGVRQWATYYGGDGSDMIYGAHGIVIDDEGYIYIAGETESTNNIATSGSYQNTNGGLYDAFIVKFNNEGVRQWATYFGGLEDEKQTTLFYENGNIWLTGSTNSSQNISSVNGMDTSYSGGFVYGDAIMTKFDTSGNMLYSSYYGDVGPEIGVYIVMDSEGYLYMGGVTGSVSGISTPGSYMPNYPGAFLWASYITKFCFEAPASLLNIQGADSTCANTNAIYYVDPIAEATAYIWTVPNGWTYTQTGSSINVIPNGQSGVITVQVIRCGDSSAVSSKNIHVHAPTPATITQSDNILHAGDGYTNYEWLLNDVSIHTSTSPGVAITQLGNYSVVTTNEWGCKDTSEVYEVTTLTTGIDDLAYLQSLIQVYPNPSTAYINVSAPVKVNVVLSSIDGRVLTTYHDARYISLANYAEGMYWIRIYYQNGTLLKTEKVIKVK
jgi:hypothetical protein